MTTPRFPILFATDAGYVPHLAAALYSLLENNKELFLKIFIFTSRMPLDDKIKLQGICAKFNTPIEFVFLDDSYFDGLILSNHFNRSNYYRLFAAELIDDRKCLYLDADIIVTGSISDLIFMGLDNDAYLAAVENPGFDRHNELGMKQASGYFNSGVMLVNLERWRAMNLKDMVISFVRENREVIYFVDQCGLNAIVDGGWVALDFKYNYQTSMLTSSGRDNFLSDADPVIIHYTGSGKPWHLNNKHSYKKDYWKYRNKTPYRSFLPDDFNLSSIARYLLPSSLKSLIKKIIGKTLK